MNKAIHAFGEGMLELAIGAGDRQIGYGGDVFNTAMYLARLGASVEFVSALGAIPLAVKHVAIGRRPGFPSATALKLQTKLWAFTPFMSTKMANGPSPCGEGV